MLQNKDILDHIDALVRLSHDVNDRAVSEKLREMADELRIMVSIADIADLTAGWGPKAPKVGEANGALIIAKKAARALPDDTAERAVRFVQAKYTGLSYALACPRAGAP